jgi:ectoine hydroxylase-related dioxygenase (phytanoyl-CoA dioxygenase family)
MLLNQKQLPCVGDYIAVSEPSLVARFEHVPIPAGAALFWDQRLPHANARRNNSGGARMVVYGGFLPRGPAINDAYAVEQRRRLLLAQAQPDFWMGRCDHPLASPGPPRIKAAISNLPGHARDLLGFSKDDDDTLI